MKGLSAFQYFSLEDFLEGKKLVFVKAEPWTESEGDTTKLEGSKVKVQIFEDNTKYAKDDVTNFGELLTIKVRGIAHTAYNKLKPLATQVVITKVEKAVIWGDFRNELSITAVIEVKQGEAT